ncbi:MAG: hypothetical protein DHS20C11_14760 [Lysobacteraceae bacterium]|nr:MAG: hypothetical protein DHS20C11_14760 [Xanthomonadaceae bacterium]
MKQTPEQTHFLTRPNTIKWLWIIFSLVLAGLVALQLLIPIKGRFALEQGFAFAAWFGFGSCVAMVLLARVLGWWLKRSEDYYQSMPSIEMRPDDD